MNRLKDKSAKNSVNQNISQNFLLAALKVKRQPKNWKDWNFHLNLLSVITIENLLTTGIHI